MGYLSKNSWINYVARSSKQILDYALIQLAFKVPEITDYNASNPFIRVLEFLAGISEQLGYYIDNAARETHIDSARLYSSLISKSKEFDYQVIGNIPHQVDVNFLLNQAYGSDITIPIGAVLSNTDGTIKYKTTAIATVLAGQLTSNLVNAIQSEIISGVSKGISTGLPDMEVVFTDKVVHNSISLTWDGNTWTPVSTLAYSSPTDQVFVQTVNEEGNTIVYFGNGYPAGAVPPTGQSMLATYSITLGADGGVGIGELSKIVSGVTLPPTISAKVTNPVASAGGGDTETIEQLKRHIPIANRTLGRAVTREDFADIMELCPGVSSAGVVYNCGKQVDIYIVPDGGGIASTGLINTAQAFINKRKMITTNPIIYAAGELVTKITADVTIGDNYFKSVVNNAVKENIAIINSDIYQKVNGSQHQSDFYQAIETTEGVEFSVITSLYIVPYARPTNNTTPPLVWTRTIKPAATIITVWRIVFVGSSSFKVLRGATLIGTYSTGTTVDLTEIQFAIPAGAYSNGNSYEFVVYPYNFNTVDLLEPSLPVTRISDVTLNIKGGI